MPDTNPRASLEFVLGQMDMKLANICREVGEIKAAMECKSKDCVECREGIDSDITTLHIRINGLKKTDTEEQAVKGWKDKTLGEVGTIVGAGLGIFTFIIWFVKWLLTGSVP